MRLPLCVIAASCFGDDLIQLFIALRRAQATTNRFVRQPFGHQGERMQVSFCLVGRHQQREQQVDRLIVDRVEGDGGFQLDKNADSTQRILFQFSVGNGDTIARYLSVGAQALLSALRM